jgi:signal transduction histidine kinase
MALRIAGMVAWTWNPTVDRVTAEENLQDVFGIGAIATVQDLIALVHADDRERHRTELEALAKAGGKYQSRFRINRPGASSPIWLEELAVAIADDARGRVRLVVGVSIDVSERVRREQLQAAELDRSKDELRALTASLLHAQEDERRRIARELHDDFGQRLALAHMQVDQLKRDLPPDSPGLSGPLEFVAGHLIRLCEDARRLSHQLHPSVIEDLGLEVALRQLIEQLERTHGLVARVSSELSSSVLPLNVSTPLYRIAQEALRNAIKHAPGAPVTIELAVQEGAVQMKVRDEGPGIGREALRAGGLGIISMEERARLARGSLSVREAPGGGTELVARVPLESARSSAG